MSWIDEAVAEVKGIHARKDAIAGNAITTYNNLWGEITNQVNELMVKGRQITTNGSHFDRILRMTVPLARGQTLSNPKECNLRLDDNREIIQATGGGVSLQFNIDVCNDGVICLKHQGKEIAIDEAAKLILRPFAFPELYPAG